MDARKGPSWRKSGANGNIPKRVTIYWKKEEPGASKTKSQLFFKFQKSSHVIQVGWYLQNILTGG